jgi:hypothetical protein
MARGWESKSVEEAQLEAPSRRRVAEPPKFSALELESQRKCESMKLQRIRVLRDLSTCKNDHVRKTLEDGLSYLDSQISLLTPSC